MKARPKMTEAEYRNARNMNAFWDAMCDAKTKSDDDQSQYTIGFCAGLSLGYRMAFEKLEIN